MKIIIRDDSLVDVNAIPFVRYDFEQEWFLQNISVVEWLSIQG